MGFLNDCWKDLFQVLVALGALGTFGAFILLFKKDKEKQEQLNTLIRIAEIDGKRLKYQAAPKLWLNGAGTRPTENLIQIDLNNKGKRARLLEFQQIQGNFTFTSEYLPYDLDEDTRRYIFLNPIGQQTNSTYYKIAILYNDDIGTSYKMIIEGTGSNVKVISDTEIGTKSIL